MMPAWVVPALGASVTILINVAACLIAWGVLQGTVKALIDRVQLLEAEIAGVTDLKLQVVKIETRLEAMVEQLKDLNASIRWMRSVPEYEPPSLHDVTGRRRGK